MERTWPCPSPLKRIFKPFPWWERKAYHLPWMKHNELRDINCNVREAVVWRNVKEILRNLSQHFWRCIIIYRLINKCSNRVSPPEIGKFVCKVHNSNQTACQFRSSLNIVISTEKFRWNLQCLKTQEARDQMRALYRGCSVLVAAVVF